MKNKINVNISPNPLDLQTLHCSQNDTGERKFYFTLHNNGEVIDTSDISDPIFEPFSVYKGGTEQLLPVNTDDPTTSPIIADIQYPDEKKTEQEFTYRESPTTLDGNAVIEKLYGNTLVWNQLVQELGGNGASVTVSNNVYTVVSTGVATLFGVSMRSNNTTYKTVVGHKYLFKATISNLSVSNPNYLVLSGGGISSIFPAQNGNISVVTSSATSSQTLYFNCFTNGTSAVTDTMTITNPQLFDLTAMFGSTKADEIYAMEQSVSGSGVAYFRSLFPLNYYSYGQKLLPFKGEGIKTTGKNLFDAEAIVTSSGHPTYCFIEDGYLKYKTGNPNTYGFVWSNLHLKCPLTFSGSVKNFGSSSTVININFITEDGATISLNNGSVDSNSSKSFSITVGTEGQFVDRIQNSWNSNLNAGIDLTVTQLEFGSTATTYEPYTSSTTSIPTSTYFPNGMMSAGNVRDDLTNSKATKRIEQITLDGSEPWHAPDSSGVCYISLNSMKRSSDYTQTMTATVAVSTHSTSMLADQTSVCGYRYHESYQPDKNWLYLKLANQTQTVENVIAYLQNNPITLNYELVDEEVTQFTHASLICEDGESTLYQDVDSLVCDCTEDFSKDSGFKDCKIKFSKGDGVVYSNKIQLHIERKP